MVDADSVKLVATIPSRWPLNPCYFHSFGMTEHFYILIEQPLHVNILKLKYMKYLNKSYAQAMKFEPKEKVTNFVCLIDFK